MSMISDIATEGTIQTIIAEIKKELEANKDNSGARAVLRKIGRFALTQFDWSTPDWAREYQELFAEDQPAPTPRIIKPRRK
jgi:hypothetical protein